MENDTRREEKNTNVDITHILLLNLVLLFMK